MRLFLSSAGALLYMVGLITRLIIMRNIESLQMEYLFGNMIVSYGTCILTVSKLWGAFWTENTPLFVMLSDAFQGFGMCAVTFLAVYVDFISTSATAAREECLVLTAFSCCCFLLAAGFISYTALI